MRKAICSTVGLLGALAMTPSAWGHGTPASVTVVEGRLTVEGNAPVTAGFTDQIFAETIAGSALLPVTQNRLFTDFPGFDVRDVSVGSGLWIETLMLDADPGPGITPRGVWWWSPTSESVEPLPGEFRLDLISARGFGFTSLAPEESLAEALQLMEPLAVDLNNHRHPLYYVVPNGSAAPVGAYGFFARLTSPAYEPSAPFLIGLNHGLAAGQFVAGVQAINEAAWQIPGDYNYDGAATTDDYTAWRDEFGLTGTGRAADGNHDGVVDVADYTVWRDAVASPQSAPPTIAIPEPVSLCYVAWGVVSLVARRKMGGAHRLATVATGSNRSYARQSVDLR
jgi:hypothetical protein